MIVNNIISKPRIVVPYQINGTTITEIPLNTTGTASTVEFSNSNKPPKLIKSLADYETELKAIGPKEFIKRHGSGVYQLIKPLGMSPAKRLMLKKQIENRVKNKFKDQFKIP